MARKYLISYSRDWARKTLNIPKIKSLREQSKELGIIIKPHDEVFDENGSMLSRVLDASENGFEDIVSREKIKKIQAWPYSEAFDWLLDDPNSRLISIMMLITQENSSDIWRIERNLDGVKYYMNLLYAAKKAN